MTGKADGITELAQHSPGKTEESLRRRARTERGEATVEENQGKAAGALCKPEVVTLNLYRHFLILFTLFILPFFLARLF